MPINFAHIKTSTFRLSAIYLFLFALSVGAILAYVYWSTAGLLERQSDETIRADVQALADQYRMRGMVGIVDTIRRRVQDEDESTYLLVAPDGRTIAGNLDLWPSHATGERGWIEFTTNSKSKTGLRLHNSRAYYTILPNGYQLLAGRDVNGIRQLGEIFQRTILGLDRHHACLGACRRVLDEPQFSAARRFDYRCQPLDHGRRPCRPHAGFGIWRRARPIGPRLERDARPDRAAHGRHEGSLQQYRA